jgi:hypothetical protein
MVLDLVHAIFSFQWRVLTPANPAKSNSFGTRTLDCGLRYGYAGFTKAFERVCINSQRSVHTRAGVLYAPDRGALARLWPGEVLNVRIR